MSNRCSNSLGKKELAIPLTIHRPFRDVWRGSPPRENADVWRRRRWRQGAGGCCARRCSGTTLMPRPRSVARRCYHRRQILLCRQERRNRQQQPPTRRRPPCGAGPSPFSSRRGSLPRHAALRAGARQELPPPDAAALGTVGAGLAQIPFKIRLRWGRFTWRWSLGGGEGAAGGY
jgi:hypothetical protein